ncbi:MAG: hypothetical protein VX079_11030 [Pseudomonadota bacterium]|nr:hypothetical protein [Pseudomonadota bacterium]
MKDFRVVREGATECGAVRTPVHKIGPVHAREFDVGGLAENGGQHLVMGITGILKRCDKLIAETPSIAHICFPPSLAKLAERVDTG